MEIILCIPTLKNFQGLIDCIHSAKSGSVRPDQILILDNSMGALSTYIEENNIPTTDSDVTVLLARYNLGCAQGWNAMMEIVMKLLPDAYCLISNDDIIFHHDTIELFSRAIEDNPDEIIYCSGGVKAANAFSLFACNPKKLADTVGWFDENIWPAYYEDGSMYYCLKMAGYDLYRIPNCNVDHYGSKTLELMTEEEKRHHHRSFQRNTEYMLLKHGSRLEESPEYPKFKYLFDSDGTQEDLEQKKKSALDYLRSKYGY